MYPSSALAPAPHSNTRPPGEPLPPTDPHAHKLCAPAGPLGVLIVRMKNWMLGFIQRHGFWGILLLAAYPNAAFDLCGICCGHFLMPFWQFFGATLLGKGVIKASARAGRLGAGGRCLLSARRPLVARQAAFLGCWAAKAGGGVPLEGQKRWGQ